MRSLSTATSEQPLLTTTRESNEDPVQPKQQSIQNKFLLLEK